MLLCWALVEQARHEHMSNEYKNRHFIDGPLVIPIMGIPKTREHLFNSIFLYTIYCTVVRNSESKNIVYYTWSDIVPCFCFDVPTW